MCELANSVLFPQCLCSRIIPQDIQESAIIVPFCILSPQQTGGKGKFLPNGIALSIMYCLPMLNPGDSNEGEQRRDDTLPPLPWPSYNPETDTQHASVLCCLLAPTTGKGWWWLAFSIMPLHRDFCRVGRKDFFYNSLSLGEPLRFLTSAEKQKLFWMGGNFSYHLPHLQWTH